MKLPMAASPGSKPPTNSSTFSRARNELGAVLTTDSNLFQRRRNGAQSEVSNATNGVELGRCRCFVGWNGGYVCNAAWKARSKHAGKGSPARDCWRAVDHAERSDRSLRDGLQFQHRAGSRRSQPFTSERRFSLEAHGY